MAKMRDKLLLLVGKPISFFDGDEMGIEIDNYNLHDFITLEQEENQKYYTWIYKIKSVEDDYFVIAKYSISIRDKSFGFGVKELPNSEETYNIRFVRKVTAI